MDDSEFHRLKRLPPYVFAEVNAMKARARGAGQDVIDLGMGNPDLPTAPHIVAKLAEAAANPRAHGYSASRGIPGLRRAQAAYYARRFNVDLDPESEIIVTLGSKEGLANLAQAITSPGDIVLVPNPSYPIHPYGFIIAGGSVRHIPVPGSTSLDEFLPALERAVRHTVPKPIALVLNYPSNPTAQVVDLDFYAAVIVTLGSKEGLANLAQAITSPGDIVLVPNPSYPIHPYGFIIAGGSVRHIPVPGSTSLDEFLPALERAVRHTVPKPIALVLNYPSNPTAQVVDLDFYAAVVDFCKRQGIWILSDLAYAEIYFDDTPPPSVLQVPGARDIAVEFTSMSKTYSMAGWRIGFAAGNRTLIQALTRIKSYLDYGAFTPIQVAATAALNGPQDCIAEARATYKERRDVLIEGLTAAGWDLPAPSASMFAWAPIPKDFAELGSLAFSKLMLTQANVAVSPGIGFGEHGDAHVRIALVENKHRIRQAIRNIRQVLADPARSIDLYLRGVGDNIAPLKARA